MAERAARLRQYRSLSQAEAAGALGVAQSTLSEIESGRIGLSLERALAICDLYRVPISYLVHGSVFSPEAPPCLAAELAYYGVSDLAVERGRVPAAFRRPEEVLALALQSPAPRIVEGLPALLFRTPELDPPLLRGFARSLEVEVRVAWIIDIASALERTGLVPHPWPVRTLTRLREGFSGLVPARDDDLGVPALDPAGLPPASRRWRILYDQDLAGFAGRTNRLLEVTRAEPG